MSWDITRTSKYGFMSAAQSNESDKISLSEWQNYVNSDDELTWAEDSPASKLYLENGRDLVKKERFQMNAYYEINKIGVGSVRFHYMHNRVRIHCERSILRRVIKMWEVTQSLDGILYKNGIKFTEKKLIKLQEKYNKK